MKLTAGLISYMNQLIFENADKKKDEWLFSLRQLNNKELNLLTYLAWESDKFTWDAISDGNNEKSLKEVTAKFLSGLSDHASIASAMAEHIFSFYEGRLNALLYEQLTKCFLEWRDNPQDFI